MPFDHVTGAPGGAPHAVGSKYHDDGRIMRFAGNTLIAHVTQTSPLFAALVAMQDGLRSGSYADKFAFLPPSSLHMTVFEGVNDPEREPERWPKDLPLDAPLDTMTDAFLDRIHGIAAPLPFRLTPVALDCSPRGGSYLRLTGADEAEESKLRGFRDQLSKALNHSKPNHTGYVWHITLSYQIAWLTEAQAAEFEQASTSLFADFVADWPEIVLDRCEFCVFDDMAWFRPLRRLG